MSKKKIIAIVVLSVLLSSSCAQREGMIKENNDLLKENNSILSQLQNNNGNSNNKNESESETLSEEETTSEKVTSEKETSEKCLKSKITKYDTFIQYLKHDFVTHFNTKREWMPKYDAKWLKKKIDEIVAEMIQYHKDENIYKNYKFEVFEIDLQTGEKKQNILVLKR